MKTALIEINNVLESVLVQDVLKALPTDGEPSAISSRAEGKTFGLFYYELLNLCGNKAEGALGRGLYRSELLYMSGKIEEFLKVGLKP